ncbi:MAG: Pyridoxamine 5'-phosphate oxidase [Parcubacteria group bacterium Gr01-1014_44]|nr:MAG: Pyridoxamine 5'-phosphate oxidase [Parcubacteria group bacterium Gr01-1014_44]
MADNYEQKPREDALKFLQDNRTMVVASVSDSGEPQASTVYYAVDDDFNFSFITSKGSRKCDNLTNNGRVAFVIGFGPRSITVQGGGRALLMDSKDSEVFMEILRRNHLSSSLEWPVLELAKEGFCTFKIVPSWLVWLNFDSKEHLKASGDKFHKII